LPKSPPIIRDKYLDTILQQAKFDREHLLERIKVMEKRFDWVQDEYAKFAIEQQALMKGMKVIVEIANDLTEAELKKTPEGQRKLDKEKKHDSQYIK